MKKLTSIITIITIMMNSNGNTYFKSFENIYPETAIIQEVNTDTDLVMVQTLSGNIFEFYGVEDYSTGDIVSMIIDSGSTPEVTDDKILSVKYSGYIQQMQEAPEADLFMEYLEAIENGSYTE